MALSSQALKRLSKEYLDTLRQPPEPLLPFLAPISPDDITRWTATIAPPAHTLYHPGHYTLSITVPPTYPLTPPTISFQTRIAHPNVAFKTGEICLDVLKEAWTPAWGVRSACLAVVGLLESPGWESPLDVDLAVLWRSGEEVGYEGLVRYYVGRYACGHLEEEENDCNGENDENEEEA